MEEEGEVRDNKETDLGEDKAANLGRVRRSQRAGVGRPGTELRPGGGQMSLQRPDTWVAAGGQDSCRGLLSASGCQGQIQG